MTKHIFLSHSSSDASLAELLEAEIKREFHGNVEVFRSTRPDAIPSGKDWLKVVLENLDKADALIMLITETSLNSVWVGFELGYFWKKTNKQNIFTLYHPKVSVPSPLDTLQAKRITDEEEVRNFFEAICISLDREFENRANLNSIIEMAKTLESPTPERSLARFEKYLETFEWELVDEEDYSTWVCLNDALYQIEVSNKLDEIQKCNVQWLEEFRLGDRAIYKVVRLKISNVVIKKLFFILFYSARLFVPDTSSEVLNYTEPYSLRFYWTKESLEFKVAKHISTYHYDYPNYTAIAKKAGIEIR